MASQVIELIHNRTVHVSRTMMLEEISRLLESAPLEATFEDYAQAILEDNVLLKRTVSNREKTLRFLRELYTLDPVDPIFAVFRLFWQVDMTGRPLLSLLNAAFRDEVLRPSCEVILQAKARDSVTKEELCEAVGRAYPERFGDKSLDKIGRNIASTWTQSGHLAGRIKKARRLVKCTPGTAAFAFYLGWLQGERGLRLYETLWARLLDASDTDLDGSIFVASQRGWLRYKRLGDVVEIDFAPIKAVLEGSRVES